MFLKKRGDIISISEIIKDIANILQYFVPGFIGLHVFKFCASKKIRDKFEIVLCCVFSYIMNALCILAYGRWPNFTILSNVYGKVIVSTAGFTIICVLCALIVRRSEFEKMCVFLFHVSPKSDLLDDVLDTRDAVNLRIYLKSDRGSVYGHYAGRDDDVADPWIAIKEPIVYSEDGTHQDFGNSVFYLIRIADIDHMVVD